MKRRIKILAVDREEIILKSIRKALKSDEGLEYEITACGTALEGLQLIRSDSFDIVFIDIVLPGINGIEILRRIKNICPGIPVIIMSGFASERIHSPASNMASSADEQLNSPAGYLLKPFTTEEINSIVVKILGSTGS